jgi:hypothetical protein
MIDYSTRSVKYRNSKENPRQDKKRKKSDSESMVKTLEAQRPLPLSNLCVSLFY